MRLNSVFYKSLGRFTRITTNSLHRSTRRSFRSANFAKGNQAPTDVKSTDNNINSTEPGGEPKGEVIGQIDPHRKLAIIFTCTAKLVMQKPFHTFHMLKVW